MKEFWNERFSSDEYVYGVLPNAFFKEQINKLPAGKILLPAEGEGRNAVYAAKLGWEVDAVDFSKEGKRKALDLAQKEKVKINYVLSDLGSFHTDKRYDLIGLFYAHMPSESRTKLHADLSKFLNKKGSIILEAFSEEQINKDTGGPKNIEMLFSQKKLEHDFIELKIDYLAELATEIQEGSFHKGLANIIRLVATMP